VIANRLPKTVLANPSLRALPLFRHRAIVLLPWLWRWQKFPSCINRTSNERVTQHNLFQSIDCFIHLFSQSYFLKKFYLTNKRPKLQLNTLLRSFFHNEIRYPKVFSRPSAFYGDWHFVVSGPRRPRPCMEEFQPVPFQRGRKRNQNRKRGRFSRRWCQQRGSQSQAQSQSQFLRAPHRAPAPVGLHTGQGLGAPKLQRQFNPDHHRPGNGRSQCEPHEPELPR